VLVRLHRIIRKRFDRFREGVDVSADVNAVIAANVGEPGATTHVSSSSRVSSSAGGKDRPAPDERADQERR
jgi:hypothetical protein